MKANWNDLSDRGRYKRRLEAARGLLCGRECDGFEMIARSKLDGSIIFCRVAGENLFHAWWAGDRVRVVTL